MAKKLKNIYIGIDVGSTNGAYAIVDDEGIIYALGKVPVIKVPIKSKRISSKLNKETGKYEKDYLKRTWVDFRNMGELFLPYVKENIIYTVEKVSVRPGEGEPSSFIFGNSLGIFQGLYPFLKPIAYYEPTPNEWKKELGVTSDKSTSIETAEEIFNVNLKDYLPKGKVDDIAEALLLACYGMKKYNEID